ncbi:MAG: Asp-tRNA(Asn)/Glu-tRNA(Gln) amidotransferase subunit GatC [bacterium]
MEIKDVKKLAQLSRVHLSDEEAQELGSSLDSILGYVEQVKQVSSDTDIEATFYSTNIMREDINPNETGINREKLVNSAPRKEGNYIKVKKILGLISE